MKNSVCQSCGMPLHGPNMYGTDSKGIAVEDYCVYCYKDGQFTSDVTMDEMMRLCANYVGESSAAFYIASMRTVYPHLKRWAKKENTQSEYYKSINKVLEYVKENLHENTVLKTLAEIANISPYHFHRIFKAVIGESVADYVNRLRMEYVANRLQTSALSLAELAVNTGYSSEQSLSRAFKKYFDLPPKVFRATFFKVTFKDELSPRICKVAAKNVISLHEHFAGKESWQRLYMYAIVNRLLSDATESIEVIDDSYYRPAISTKDVLPPSKHVQCYTLPEGLYAIFTHKGDTKQIPELYAAIHNYWLPASKYKLGEAKCYAVYLNNPATVATENLLTEIYIPLS